MKVKYLTYAIVVGALLAALILAGWFGVLFVDLVSFRHSEYTRAEFWALLWAGRVVVQVMVRR